MTSHTLRGQSSESAQEPIIRRTVPVLRSKRLTLPPVCVGHAAELGRLMSEQEVFSLWERGQPLPCEYWLQRLPRLVERWQLWEHGDDSKLSWRVITVHSPSDAELPPRQDKNEAKAKEGEADEDHDRGEAVIGFVGVGVVEGHHQEKLVQVAYALDHRHWGKGYASEALELVIDGDVRPMRLPNPSCTKSGERWCRMVRVYAPVHPDNVRSIALARRLGMQEVEVASDLLPTPPANRILLVTSVALCV